MIEHRAVEIEPRGYADKVEGVVIRYGDVAHVGNLQERFTPGAFGKSIESSAIRVNWQHSRDRPIAVPSFIDSPTELRAEFALPDTSDGRDARELLRQGVLTGLSVEFTPVEERFEDGVRVIERANIHGLGLVDYPAYRESLATLANRWLENRTFTTLPGNIRIPFL